jgi:predicted CopG family antitoxin
MGTHTKNVSKNIAISDEVYRRLKREKGNRSFSEVIAAKLDAGGRLGEVTGQGVLDPEAHKAAQEEIERLSEGTLDRVDDEAL